MQVAPGANESSMEIADGAESQKARKPTDVQKPKPQHGMANSQHPAPNSQALGSNCMPAVAAKVDRPVGELAI